jgi:hypothetical protein
MLNGGDTGIEKEPIVTNELKTGFLTDEILKRTGFTVKMTDTKLDLPLVGIIHGAKPLKGQ